ncbi:GNAT family N-acetyltransferase [Limosilactobacillus ingluviei]|uniref:GNAT family N-acetyltransferase n=1 Tax=Limosilactobacillus ingluviei TaxID=148604 RepID=UPI001DDA599B|nr:GNAT family N-acetyltransferase [Limosilactobacillus ingluviei]MDO4604007.1 GNAT family N-acetyltransferase [Limosilactobacillus ingluviei]HJG50369.1 GNAT family N-acetyltransferase [Limosilactobacillus ingluviei]
MAIPILVPASTADLPAIMTIIDQAKAALKAAGSPQWQTGYPNQATIETDLAAEQGWVLRLEQTVVGYLALVVGDEPTYQHIDGAWADTTAPYATLHRVALSDQYRGQGLGKFMLSTAISVGAAQGIRNFRIDTYQLNQPVQTLVKAAGFSHRGTIYVNEPNHPERLAFELNL